MAAKKKPNPSASEPNASTEAPPSTDNALVPSNGNNTIDDHDEDLEVEDLADGGLEVDLHDLGISVEDIQAMERIDARLAERQLQAQQAQAGTSNVAAATKKGKGHQPSAEELEEQLNKLKEQELRCKAMRQSIRDHLVKMKPPRQDPRLVQQVPQPQGLRRQTPFTEDQYSDEEEGEYVIPNQLRPQ